LPELEGLDTENKTAVTQVLESLQLFQSAVKNNEDVQDLRALIVEKRDEALKGNRVAKTAIRAYRDELFGILNKIAVNFTLSVTALAGGIVLVKSAAALGMTTVGILLGVGGIITVVIGALSITIASITAFQALYGVWEAVL
jgi:hypothetical protein